MDLSSLSKTLTPFEILVCFVQQALAAGAEFYPRQGKLALRATCPKVRAEVVEVLNFLRELSAVGDEGPGFIDHHLQRMVSGPTSMKLGGINWQPEPAREDALATSWLFSEHQQALVADCIGKQVWMPGDVPTGRLEGCAPQRCFITPSPCFQHRGNAITQFCQRVENALPFSALAVYARPPLCINPKPPERQDLSSPADPSRKEQAL
ncbi:MAG: hypothetical protein KC800_05605 [Candidatus Eremiobacteraeota bacterium]|nr:hypothetical protein [Candidatus Eremiobacteraeota bacterium]